MSLNHHRCVRGGFWLIAVLAVGFPAAAWRSTAADPAPDKLVYPVGIAVRGEQDMFVADLEVHGVWKIDGTMLRMYFQGKKEFRTPLNRPRALAIDGEGRLLAGCGATREVYRFNAEDEPEPLTAGGIGNPIDIVVNRAGELLVSDLELHCIWKLPAAGGKPEKFVEVPAPRGLSLDGEDRLWVVSHGDKASLLRISPDKQIETIVAGRAFRFAHDVAVDKEGTAYVSDGYAETIWKVGADGKPVAWSQGDPLKSPTGMAWQGETLLVADPMAAAVFQIDAGGVATALELK
ncbi:MAG TPA: hypothetical protein VMV69_29325 [Pirellulales bacterium]|nr:hypothetical protein [Pirellulales bacterium]